MVDYWLLLLPYCCWIDRLRRRTGWPDLSWTTGGVCRAWTEILSNEPCLCKAVRGKRQWLSVMSAIGSWGSARASTVATAAHISHSFSGEGNTDGCILVQILALLHTERTFLRPGLDLCKKGWRVCVGTHTRWSSQLQRTVWGLRE